MALMEQREGTFEVAGANPGVAETRTQIPILASIAMESLVESIHREQIAAPRGGIGAAEDAEPPSEQIAGGLRMPRAGSMRNPVIPAMSIGRRL